MTTMSFLDLDEAFRRKKKAVLIIGAVLVVLLGATLLIGQAGSPGGPETPLPSAVAVHTTPPPATITPPTATPTVTSSPMPIDMPTSTPTDTASPTSTPSQPYTPTRPPSPTPVPPTPSPSPTPRPPTPTLLPSPTIQWPTPTPTVTPVSRPLPLIISPVDGSELPGDSLTVQGTAEPGTTIKVYAGDTLVGEAAVDGAGNWSLVPEERLVAGDHSIVAIDVATGATSAPITFTLLHAWLPVSGDEQPHFPWHADPSTERSP